MEYSGWQNPYAADIGHQIAQSADAQARAAEIVGQAQARAAEQSGNAWAGAVRNIGAIPQQLEQSRDAAVTRKLKEQELAQTVEARAEQTRTRVAVSVGRLAATADTPEHFSAGVDDLFRQGVLDRGTAAHIKTQIASVGPDGLPALKQQYVAFADQFQPLTKLGEGDTLIRPSVAPGAPAAVVAKGGGKPIVLRPGDVAVPDGGGAPIASAPFAPGAGQHVVNGQVVDAQGQPVGAAIPKQATPLAPDEIALKQAQLKEITAKLAGTVPMTAKDRAELALQRDHLNAQIEHWQHADDALDQAPTLSPDALDLTAKNFAMTGQLPPMGMGKQGATVRTNIINRAADLYSGLDLASQRAAYEANKKSLAGLQQNADVVGAFEATAKKNIDLFLEQAKKVPDTGIPLLNTPARWLSGQVLGSADLSGYEATRRSAINEVAKVVSSPGLSGQLSDSARKEVESFVPQNATLAQAIRVMNVLKTEMDNRSQSYADQIGAIRKRIATPPSASHEPSGPVSVTDPTGGVHVFPDLASADRFKKAAGIP